MTAPPFRRHANMLLHFAATRAPEVLALQASPLLGFFWGSAGLERWAPGRLGLLLLGSFALTAHIFIFNDWAGYGSDPNDPRRTTQVAARRGISRRQVAQVAIALLVAAAGALAALGGQALALGAAIAALSFLYSCSPRFGKSTPITGSVNHLLGGALHFLLGYGLVHALDMRGLALSLFFGLVFAGGHLNQEVRDYEGDLLNGIRTSAVAFGRQRAFLASLGAFTAAYALVAALAAGGALPSLLRWSSLVWLAHAAWSLRALRRGLGFETAVWMQRRYRLLFALIGLAMLASGLR